MADVAAIIELMDPTAPPVQTRWFHSFALRIGVGFVVSVVLIFAVQTAVFFRGQGLQPPPREDFARVKASVVAARLARSLELDRNAEVATSLRQQVAQPGDVYVLPTSGPPMATDGTPMSATDRVRFEEAIKADRTTQPDGSPYVRSMATAPIWVGPRLWGYVLVPLASAPGPEPARVLSAGVTIVIVVAVLFAVTVFEPFRRRLASLGHAAQQIQSGNLTVRAPVHGSDELAQLARSFNNMAEVVAARDEALQSADRLRRQLLADVSHELKTPLSSVRGYLETLRMPGVVLDTATRAQYFDTVEREIGRIDRLVRDLLRLARLDGDPNDQEVRIFATSRLFERVGERYADTVRKRGLALTLQINPSADQILGDPDQLEQVFDNVVANAIHHTPDGGTIAVTADTQGTQVIVVIADSGGGIAPEHLPHIFERFYKADRARGNASGGSGLGLSIARRIVELHGGSIGVASRPGRTAFTITLPNAAVGHDTSANR